MATVQASQGLQRLVAAELGKLHEHLLQPVGVTPAPDTIDQAVTAYRIAREEWERQLEMRIPRAAEEAVMRAAPPQGAASLASWNSKK